MSCMLGSDAFDFWARKVTKVLAESNSTYRCVYDLSPVGSMSRDWDQLQTQHSYWMWTTLHYHNLYCLSILVTYDMLIMMMMMMMPAYVLSQPWCIGTSYIHQHCPRPARATHQLLLLSAQWWRLPSASEAATSRRPPGRSENVRFTLIIMTRWQVMVDVGDSSLSQLTWSEPRSVHVRWTEWTLAMT